MNGLRLTLMMRKVQLLRLTEAVHSRSSYFIYARKASQIQAQNLRIIYGHIVKHIDMDLKNIKRHGF